MVAPAAAATPMLRHLVLLRFKPEATPAQVHEIEQGFIEPRRLIDRVRAVEWGTDVSPEGLARGYTRAFLLSFDDATGRDAYLPHPAHQAFVARLKPVLADLLVVDYSVAPAA